jgi:hypothetical protein
MAGVRLRLLLAIIVIVWVMFGARPPQPSSTLSPGNVREAPGWSAPYDSSANTADDD